MSRFILGFFVGVEHSVTFLLSRARVAISTLASGYEGDGVRREIGPGTVGDSKCVDEEDAEQAFAVSELSEESEEDDIDRADVEEANIELLISFVLVFDLSISSVHVVNLWGFYKKHNINSLIICYCYGILHYTVI